MSAPCASDPPSTFWAHMTYPRILVTVDRAMVSECASPSDIVFSLSKIRIPTELQTPARKSCLLKEVAEAEEKDVFFVREASGKDRLGARSCASGLSLVLTRPDSLPRGNEGMPIS